MRLWDTEWVVQIHWAEPEFEYMSYSKDYVIKLYATLCVTKDLGNYPNEEKQSIWHYLA